MRTCRSCSGAIERDHRYCPWCAAPQRSKLVEFFGGTGADDGRALRVSRYVDERHVRFSVWDETGTAEAAVSIDEAEAQRLAGFLAPPRRPRRPSLVEELRSRAGL
jgi:hypothetical protein